MRRRQNLPSSSLDLLLDTICNTFGGILFISLLVVIMLNLSSDRLVSKPVSQTQQANLLRLKRELADTTDRLRLLQQSLLRQERLATTMVDPQTETLLEKLRRLQVQRAETASDKNDVLSGSSDAQVEINKLSQLLSEIRQARQQRDSLQEQVRRKQAERTETVRPPKERQTTKVQVAMVLKGGKLYSYPRKGSRGGLEFNDDDFIQAVGPSGGYIEPKAGGGVPVNLEGPMDEKAKRKLAQFDHDTHYLAVIVWPDSFEHFAPLRREISSQRFEYSAIPWAGEDRIPVGTATPGEAARVLGE